MDSVHDVSPRIDLFIVPNPWHIVIPASLWRDERGFRDNERPGYRCSLLVVFLGIPARNVLHRSSKSGQWGHDHSVLELTVA